MRYLIETHPDKAMEIGSAIANWDKKGDITILEKGDPIEEIKSNLLKIKRAFETLEKVGINREVMVAYIRSKGVRASDINAVLFHQDAFFEKMGLK